MLFPLVIDLCCLLASSSASHQNCSFLLNEPHIEGRLKGDNFLWEQFRLCICLLSITNESAFLRSTGWLHRLATDVPFIAYVINLPCTFTHYLELSNFQFYFMIWIVVFQIFNHLSPVGLFCECYRMSLLWFTCINVIHNTGCLKKMGESGAHKTDFMDIFTWCAGCWYIFIYWLSLQRIYTLKLKKAY